MNNRAFKKLFVILLLALSILTGCSYSSDINRLLSAPRLSAEQNEILDALVSGISTRKIKLRYPKSGEYRSAIVLKNIDNEPSYEAIVFYSIENKNISNGTVRINVLDKIDDKWQSVYDIAGEGTDLERIDIDIMGNLDSPSLFVGFSYYNKDSMTVCVYSYTGNKLNLNYTASADAFFVIDMDNDTENELVTVKTKTSEQNDSCVTMTDVVGNRILKVSTVNLNPSSKDYTGILSGFIGSNTTALFIDGLHSDNTISTEIIYCVKNTLRNPVYTDFIIKPQQITRPVEYPCLDVDNDRIIEIPSLDLFPGYTANNSTIYITDWNVFKNFDIEKKYSSYYDYKNRYCFIIPSRWTGIVTAKPNESENEITFYRFDGNLASSSIPLLTIRTQYSYSTTPVPEGYRLLRSSAYADYYVKIPTESDEPLILTDTELVNNFYTME